MSASTEHWSGTFRPDAMAVREARRFAVEAAGGTGVDLSSLEMAVSELASNAVLHAGTPFELVLHRLDDGLRVAVTDGSPEAPRLRPVDPSRVTGRGLRIVEALARRWGTVVTDAGKTVWFELGLPVPDHDADAVLLGVPLELHQRASARFDALQRELELIWRADGDPAIPDRLRSLIDEARAAAAGAGDVVRVQLDAALERGDPTADVRFPIRPEVVDATARLGQALDEIDDHCGRHGALLTLVTPPDELAYRRWAIGEIVGQSAGRQPIRWSADAVVDPITAAGSRGAAGRPETATVAGSTGAGEDGVADLVLDVVGPLDLRSAPALRQRIADAMRGSTAFTIDLQRCDFIDSVGVSVLLATIVRADDDGVDVQFALSSVVRRVLQIGGVVDRLTVVGAA